MGLLAKLSEKPWVKSQSELDDLHEGGTFTIPTAWLGLNVVFGVIGVLFLLLSIAYYHHRVVHAAEYQAAAAQSASFLDLCLGSGTAWLGLPKLWLLWVREDHRGSGIGRHLVTAFEDAARTKGARRVFLSSHTFQAPEFYRRLGYVETGRRDGWPAGHSDVLLMKEL